MPKPKVCPKCGKACFIKSKKDVWWSYHPYYCEVWSKIHVDDVILANRLWGAIQEDYYCVIEQLYAERNWG